MPKSIDNRTLECNALFRKRLPLPLLLCATVSLRGNCISDQ